MVVFRSEFDDEAKEPVNPGRRFGYGITRLYAHWAFRNPPVGALRMTAPGIPQFFGCIIARSRLQYNPSGPASAGEQVEVSLRSLQQKNASENLPRNWNAPNVQVPWTTQYPPRGYLVLTDARPRTVIGLTGGQTLVKKIHSNHR